jgi:hypothetical protein
LLLLAPYGVEGAPSDRLAERPLAEVLSELQVRGLRLLFSTELVPAGLLVAVEPAPGLEPRHLLEELLAPHGLAVVDGQGGFLVVVRADDLASDCALRGSVRAAGNGAPVGGAEVRLVESGRSVRAGPGGRFSMPGIAPGSYTVEAQAGGFLPETLSGVRLAPRQVLDLSFELAPIPVTMEAIRVTPQPERVVLGSHESLSADEVGRLPQLGDDVLRAAASLPGVVGDDRQASLHIRGGDASEVLILLDGLRLIQPYHLGTVTRSFGVVDSQLIESAQLFTGSFPVEYGGRMSGVIDLASASPGGELTYLLSAGSVNARGSAQGSLPDGGRWLVSGRRWYPDQFLDLVSVDGLNLEPAYYDLLAKVQLDLGPSQSLSTYLFHANDEAELTAESSERLDARGASGYAWANYDRLWSRRFSSESALSLGRVVSHRQGSIHEPDSGPFEVDDARELLLAGLKHSWSLELSPRHEIDGGVEAQRLNTDYQYFDRREAIALAGVALVTERRELDLRRTGWDLSAYLAHRFRPLPRLTVETGLRWDEQTWAPSESEQFAPRFNLALSLGRGTTLRAGWGRFYQAQGIHELEVEDGETGYYPAQLATHVTLGLERRLPRSLTFKAELYRKELTEPRPHYENLLDPLDLFPEARSDRVRVEPERGLAQGLELSLRRAGAGRLTGWVGYSLARAEELEAGRWVARGWDQRHSVDFSLDLRWRNDWTFTASGLYHSGRPTTGLSIVGGGGAGEAFVVLGARNGERLPAFARLDLRVSRRLRLGGQELRLQGELFNLLNRRNVCCVESYELVPGAGGEPSLRTVEGLGLRLTPTIGIAWRR